MEPQTSVHAPSRPGLAGTLAAAGSLFLGTLAAHGASQADAIARGERAYREGKFGEARDAFAEVLKQPKAPPGREAVEYGLAAAAHQLKDYDSAVRSFSSALQSRDAAQQTQAHRGLGTSLYDLGDARLQQEPDFTIKAWTDSRDHFNGALEKLRQRGRGDSAEFQEIRENRDFVQKRLDELKQQRERQKQQQQKQKSQKKEKGGKGGNERDENEEPEDGKDNQPDQDAKPGDRDSQKQHDQLQKKGEQVPEGELRAKEGGPQPPQHPKEADADQQRNEKTGFTPEEARSQLRNYADDQKSAQYLMQRERPVGGKDY